MTKKCFSAITTKLSVWIIILSVLLSFPTIKFDDHGAYSFLYKYPCKHLTVTNAAASEIDSLPKWPHEKSDLRPDPALVFGRLSNGFRYVLLNNHEPKERVSVHLNIQAGSIHESDAQQGLAHFLEHMLFCGSTHFKPGELVKYFQNIGMQFGPDANAHTGFGETVYDILLPEGSSKSLEEALLVIQDYAEGALLLQSEIDRERKVVLAEKRTRDSASYRTFVSRMKFEFPEARISRRLPIGNEEVLANANRPHFKEFYDTWYRPETMILIMVGDFDSNTAASLIKGRFAKLSARAPPQPEPDLGKIKHKGIKMFYHFEKETGNTTASIEIVKKIIWEPDSVAFQKRVLIKDIADQIVQNRLDALVSKPDTPFTSASIGSGLFLHQIEFAGITAESSPENWDKSLSAIEQALRKALTYGFTKSELERVKKEFLSKLDTAVKKASTRDSQDLARKIIRHLNADRVFMSPKQEKELFSPIINSLTLNAVHDSFKETWSPEHRLVLLTGNAELPYNDTPPEHRILSVYNKSKRAGVSEPIKIQSVVFPYLPEPETKGKIINKTKIADLGVVQVDFENGVRLNLKKTDFKADEVLVSLGFSSGRSSEPADKPGLAGLCAKVINESGLGTLDKDEIKRALAGKNTHVNFRVSGDRFFFKGKTVSGELPLLFQLLYAHLTDQGYRKDAYALSMERFSQKYLSLSSSIDGAMILFGKRFLAGGDSRFGLPPYDKFKKLTLNDVRSWVATPLLHDTIEVSVVGDFDINFVIDTASKYLGSLPQRRHVHVKKQSRQPKFPVAQSVETPVATKIPKGLVIVAYPTEDLWDINRTRRLSVLAEVFSERLRDKIREKLGATYSPFAYNRPSRVYPGYGVFQAFVHVDPEQSDTIIEEIKKISSDLVENGITHDELKRALEPTLTSIKDMLRKNGYWLNTVLSGSREHPQQLDWSRTIMDDYASITTNELWILAKKYVDNKKAATIVVKPE